MSPRKECRSSKSRTSLAQIKKGMYVENACLVHFRHFPSLKDPKWMNRMNEKPNRRKRGEGRKAALNKERGHASKGTYSIKTSFAAERFIITRPSLDDGRYDRRVFLGLAQSAKSFDAF